MLETILMHEPTVRLVCFAVVFGSMLLWEVLAPRRRLSLSRLTRWPSNLGVFALNTMIVRIGLPTAAVGFAVFAAQQGWGLLNIVALPFWLAVPLAVVLLDLAIYLQHVVFHAVPVFWRLHRMHHADQDFDVTTAARFHPIEILLSMGLKFIVVVALGAPALAVLIFEVVLNGMAMFNHGNVRLPAGLDRALRMLFVTPDMHRVHHSVTPRETNSNFGFNLSVWDRLFGTYRAQPAAGHADMTIGLERFRTPRDQRLDQMLLQPFRGPADTMPVVRQHGQPTV